VTVEQATYWLWVAWYASWCAAALWASRAAARPAASLGQFHRMIATAGLVLLMGFASRPGGVGWPVARWSWLLPATRPMIAEPAWFQGVLFGVTFAGFGFCWWARLHMGRLRSGFTTVKAGHRIVDTGPFAIVRHPIYAGVMLAAIAMALIKFSPLAFVGAALFVFGFSITARLEERFLREQLGPADYDAYARRVPMLVPGLGRRPSIVDPPRA